MANKKLTFTVNITFESEINDDNDVMEVARNIAYAIKSSADSVGIAPDHCDTYTENVTVKPQFLDETFELNIAEFA